MENELEPSKSQRKRDMTALQDLGTALVDLPPAKLDLIPLPESLLQAVREAKRISAHGARRRQLQYIGKLMREVDAEAIRSALDAATNQGAEAVARMHRAERWRERLLEDEAALAEFIEGHATVDAQHLRTLIRNTRREAEQNKPPRSFRALYQEIRHALDEAPADTTSPPA
jgi:ribosome-associated protein